MGTKWVKAELPDDVVADLQKIAKSNGETAAQTLARAIATMKYLEERRDQAGRVLLAGADGLEEVRIKD